MVLYCIGCCPNRGITAHKLSMVLEVQSEAIDSGFCFRFCNALLAVFVTNLIKISTYLSFFILRLDYINSYINARNLIIILVLINLPLLVLSVRL